MNPAMMALLSQSGRGGGGRGASGGASGLGGLMGGMNSMMNNPVWLCRNTENLKMVPCSNFKSICDIISFQTYNLPNVLSCSPMGLGCCIKDAMTFMLLQRMG